MSNPNDAQPASGNMGEEDGQQYNEQMDEQDPDGDGLETNENNAPGMNSLNSTTTDD